MKNSMFKYKKRTFRNVVIVIIVLNLFIFAGLLYIINFRLTPMVKPIAISKAKTIATRAINTAVETELNNTDISYEDLVSITYDSSNRVTSLKTDTISINKLKSSLSVAILNEIANIDNTTVSVYLGDIISSELFSQKGPKFNIVLSPVGSVETDIENTFLSTGINQTRHQLNITVTANVGIVMPTYTEYADVTTSINLGESVLLGDVPENYTNVGTDPEDLNIWDELNDYIE